MEDGQRSSNPTLSGLSVLGFLRGASLSDLHFKYTCVLPNSYTCIEFPLRVEQRAVIYSFFPGHEVGVYTAEGTLVLSCLYCIPCAAASCSQNEAPDIFSGTKRLQHAFAIAKSCGRSSRSSILFGGRSVVQYSIRLR